MVLQILAFLLMSLPAVAEVIADVKEWKNNIRDKKGLDVVFRVLGMTLVGIFQSWFTDISWWQGAILSAGIFILTFDYIMGYFLTKHKKGWSLTKRLTFLGTTSRIDRFLREIHWPFVLFFRGIIFAVCITAYYDLHKIIYGNF